jgi:hypothetical protein
MFYLFSDNGNMALAKPMPEGFEVTGRLKIKNPGTRPTWAHPVVHGGRLYLRYGDKLAVYDVSAGALPHGQQVAHRPQPDLLVAHQRAR